MVRSPFTYLPESNSYICPGGQQLNYGGRNEGNRTFGYIGTRKVRSVPTEIAVHDWTVPVSCHPHEAGPLGSEPEISGLRRSSNTHNGNGRRSRRSSRS